VSPELCVPGIMAGIMSVSPESSKTRAGALDDTGGIVKISDSRLAGTSNA
jgi:hypothetical protein